MTASPEGTAGRAMDGARGARLRRPIPAVVAYVNEPGPARGPDALLAQLRTIRRRAARDGVAIGRFVAESGGAATWAGLGRRLALTIAAAACEPMPRILYVVDTGRLASDPAAELEALELCFKAGFEVRAGCGRIAPGGRRVAALRRAAVRVGIARPVEDRPSPPPWGASTAPTTIGRGPRSPSRPRADLGAGAS